MADIERLINAIDAAEEFAYGSDQNSDLNEDRARAIDYYYGRNVEPAPEGRSQVVDRSVFESIQWLLPSLCRIFANGDSVVEFTPLGEEDEEPARQESDYLNYLIVQKNPWFEIFLQWAQDALLSKNGYCMAYMEEKLHTEEEVYERQADEAVALLLEQEGVEVIAHEAVPDENDPVPVMDDFGQPIPDEFGQPLMQARVYHNITLKRVTPEKKLCFRVLPPERCLVAETADSWNLEDADYFEFWDFVSISELRKMGFEVEDDIASDEDVHTEEDYARDIYLERQDLRNNSPVDASMRRVKARMVWIRHDYDDDGIAELNHVWRVGRQILTKDGKPYIQHATRIPVSCIVPMVNTHRHIGTSVADLDGDIQRIKTVFLRAGIDNLQFANNTRHVISDMVNLDDMLISRPGGVVRLAEGAIPSEGHVMPLVTPDVFPNAMRGMDYMDSIREGRTGVSRAFSGVDPEIVNKAASGTAINQVSTMAAQRVEQMARIMASGVRYLFSVAHELILRHGHRKETLRLRGQWVTVDPSTWKTGRDMRIVVGYGAGNKDALINRIMLILQAQKEAATSGLPVVDPQNIYEALIELTKAADFSSPERFWTDPATVPPQEPQEDPLITAQKLIEGERFASNERIKQAELMQRESESQRDERLKRDLANLDAEVRIMVEQLQQGGDIDLERAKAEFRDAPIRVEAARIEETRDAVGMLADSQSKQIEKLASMVSELSKSLNKPKKVLRDEAGKVIGVQ